MISLALGACVAVLFAALLLVIRRQRVIAFDLRIKEAELTASRDRLRRYVADLERIADVASHDLQEPLRNVVAYSQLLAQHEHAVADDEVRSYVSHVVDGARRMKDLVGGLRAFVAVENVPVSDGRVSAATAMATARSRLAECLAASDAALVVDPLPEVVADEASLTEIFVQLIENGVRFSSPGRRPVIHVWAERRGSQVAFRVRDNGIGIDPSRAARVFEVFFRPHGSESGKSADIGMGLAVARRLVERLGGQVWVDSEPGKGSVFGFSLPAEPHAAARVTNSGREVATAA